MSFIQVHALVHFVSLVYASLDSLRIYLALVREALLGVVCESASPPINLHSHSGAACICPFFLKLGAKSNTLDIFFAGFSTIFDLDSLLRAPLCSWGSYWWFNIFEVFGGGSKVVGELSLRFLRDLALRFCPDLLYFSFIVSKSSISFNRPVLLTVSWNFLLFSCVQGVLKC